MNTATNDIIDNCNSPQQPQSVLINKEKSDSSEGKALAVDRMLDSLLQMGEEWKMGNFDAAVSVAETQFPLITSHRTTLKRLMTEIYDQLEATQETLERMHGELTELQRLYSQLASISLWDLPGRARLSMLITRHLMEIPSRLRRPQQGRLES